jgi:hypothetical protein
MNGEVYEAAAKFLEEGEIPDEGTSPRWMFLAACLRESYNMAKRANDRCEDLEKADIALDGKFKTMQTRWGLLGGLIIIAEALVILWQAF